MRVTRLHQLPPDCPMRSYPGCRHDFSCVQLGGNAHVMAFNARAAHAGRHQCKAGSRPFRMTRCPATLRPSRACSSIPVAKKGCGRARQLRQVALVLALRAASLCARSAAHSSIP